MSLNLFLENLKLLPRFPRWVLSGIPKILCQIHTSMNPISTLPELPQHCPSSPWLPGSYADGIVREQGRVLGPFGSANKPLPSFWGIPSPSGLARCVSFWVNDKNILAVQSSSSYPIPLPLSSSLPSLTYIPSRALEKLNK